jgi:predicted MPP superfamily phosphohydrolase
MQMGILTKKFKWSPSKYFYPHWNGLYSKDDQFLYVNRGFGVLAVPFRIWMPPEITVIKLETE